jgi:hypothetical protein
MLGLYSIGQAYTRIIEVDEGIEAANYAFEVIKMKNENYTSG